MAKVLYIPFSVKEAGQLSNRLKYSEEIQEGYSPDKRAQGMYRGFRDTAWAGTKKIQESDYLYAPIKIDGIYKETKSLAGLTNEQDQLYINAHCNRGLDYLSTEQKCGVSNPKVDVPDLVEQLSKHGLPIESPAKIKLWACHAALGVGPNRSFAEQFSEAMFKKGYVRCRIFAYTESLLSQYMTGPGDTEVDRGYHKRANVTVETKSDEAMLRAAVANPGRMEKSQLAVWNFEKNGKSFDDAIQSILKSELKVRLFRPKSVDTASVGSRAKLFRKEFKNGTIVGN